MNDINKTKQTNSIKINVDLDKSIALSLSTQHFSRLRKRNSSCKSEAETKANDPTTTNPIFIFSVKRYDKIKKLFKNSDDNGRPIAARIIKE